MNYINLLRELQSPESMNRLARLYGHREGTLVSQIRRYNAIIKLHKDIFRSEKPLYVISSPGRTEIIGNHTDHNRGKVLAAAINLDTLAVVTAREDTLVNLHSEGYPPMTIDLGDLSVDPREEGTSAALIRGVADGMARAGFRIGGFDAAVTSDVLGGSGLSSSAAFEVMVGCVFNTLYNDSGMDSVQRAKIAQYAENVHFGKPSGLMDQMASSVGGMTAIDFKQDEPKIEPLSFGFDQAGYALVVVGTGGSHDDLTPQYAAIREEMNAAAACFGEQTLRAVRREEFYRAIPQVREACGDRAVLRAMHYYQENERVTLAVEALRADDLDSFFAQINASGRSSWQLLQNISPQQGDQPLAIALALAEETLGGRGACRVHGGGFAGTTLNFVPDDLLPCFVKKLEAVFGSGSCHILDVRSEGAVRVF